MMNNLQNISEFFSHIGCPFRIYAMGRLIIPVTTEDFMAFEQTRVAWPYPLLRQAWFAILFWMPEHNEQALSAQPVNNQPNVWFLKFPLDEQAKINLGSRDEFLHKLLNALKDYLTSNETDPLKKFQLLEAHIKNSPNGFTPNQEAMANFHASVHQTLNLPASRFMQPALDYINGKQGFEHWNFIAYQGLADIAARLSETNDDMTLEAIIIRSLPQLPSEPLIALLHCLENHPLPELLSQAVIERLQSDLKHVTGSMNQSKKKDINPLLVAALIRSLARSAATQAKRQVLKLVLSSSCASHIEILAAVSGRCWTELKDPELLLAFLEALATNSQGQPSFNAIMTDLLFIPGMRQVVLKQLRSPQRSARLERSIGELFHQPG